MTASEKDLTAGEGVNERSADGTDESAEGTGGAVVTGALAAASEDGRPTGEYDPAPPLDVEGASRTEKESTSPGQESQVGEG